MSNPKVTIIGAGQVGATTAQRLLEKDLCDVVLFDIVEGLAKGKALDLMQAAPLEGHTKNIEGTDRYADIEDSRLIVVTAGLPRKPGMSREDLLQANAKIIQSIAENLKKVAPESIVITVTNPLDVMTHLLQKLTGFQEKKLFGMAGILDSARMRLFIAQKRMCIPREVSAMVLGGHGDLMVPIMSQAKIRNEPISLNASDEKEIIQRTQNGGAEIVSHLKTGSAYYAPASSVAKMVQAVLLNTHEILPVCARCHGEYGIDDTYCGVPVKLGRNGIEEISEIPISESERSALQISAQKVKKGLRELEALIAA
jgi:malate dehydrogenase